MPVSPYHYLNETCALFVREFPTSVLDVGVGHGKWGFLCRDTLEAFVGTRYFKHDWNVRVDGIEIFAGYRNPVWDYAYDQVWIGDACELVPCLDTYDLVIAMEVIEHVEKLAAEALVAAMVARAVRGVVLSFPDATGPDALAKEESYGNPHERHLSLWSPSDLDAYACEILSPNHVFVRDPCKRRVAAVELRGNVRGAHVLREAAKGCGRTPNPWLVLVEAGSKLSIPFDGRRLHLYFVRHPHCGAAQVSIDGAELDRIDMYAEGAARYACWRSPWLRDGHHVAVVEALQAPKTGQGEVWLDDVVLERPGRPG